jgi:hypothetical protein
MTTTRLAFLSLVALIAIPAAARADAATSAAYDTSTWVNRPLLLPAGVGRGGGTVGIMNLSQNGGSAAGEYLTLDLDYGFSDNLQLGVAVALPLDPAAFGSVIGTAIFGVGPMAAIRLEGGIVRGTVDFGTLGSDGSNIGVVAAGIPWKTQLSPGLAFVTGGTTADAFGRPYALSSNGGGISIGAIPFYTGQDLVAVAFNNNSSSSSSTSGSSSSTDTVVVLQAPFALLADLSATVAVQPRAGFRVIIPSQGSTEKALPIGVDLMGRLSRLDLGASLDIAGILESGVGYFDLLQLTVWARGRF